MFPMNARHTVLTSLLNSSTAKLAGCSKCLHRCKQHFMQNHVRYYLLLKLPLPTVFGTLIYSFNLLDKDPSIPFHVLFYGKVILGMPLVFSAHLRSEIIHPDSTLLRYKNTTVDENISQLTYQCYNV